MPVSMSTPIALPPEGAALAQPGWRAVEAQHRNATIALVGGSLEDQTVLEQIIEEVKPPSHPDTAGLHYLIATPFRYRSPPPAGSRFRATEDPPVFYGAEDEKTACAEAGYWRWRFWMDSAALRERPTSLQMTLFRFHGATQRALDLTRSPLADKRDLWIHPSDYRQTQELARTARSAGFEVIRYESVRNAPQGRCLAVLTPEYFRASAEPFRNELQGWSLFIGPPTLVVWQRDLDGASFEFRF